MIQTYCEHIIDVEPVLTFSVISECTRTNLLTVKHATVTLTLVDRRDSLTFWEIWLYGELDEKNDTN